MSFHPNDIVRRGRIAALFVGLALVFLLTAFFRNQVVRNDRFVQQSERVRLRMLPIPAPRGRILDRAGKVIAESAVAYSVSFLATSEDSLRATLARLDSIVPI
jgi:penicillin-binding protein 2